MATQIRRTGEFDRGGMISVWFSLLLPNATLSMPSHEVWKAQRSTWAGTMAPSFLQNVASKSIHENCMGLIDLWKRKAAVAGGASGSAWEFRRDVRFTTLDIIWQFALGDNLGVLASRTFDDAAVRKALKQFEHPPQPYNFIPAAPPVFYGKLQTLLDTVQEMIQSPFPTLTRKLISRRKEYKEADDMKNTKIRAAIEQSRQKWKGNKDQEITCAMDYVIQREETLSEKYKGLATDADMEDELLSFIVGGFDSVSKILPLNHTVIDRFLSDRNNDMLWIEAPPRQSASSGKAI